MAYSKPKPYNNKKKWLMHVLHHDWNYTDRSENHSFFFCNLHSGPIFFNYILNCSQIRLHYLYAVIFQIFFFTTSTISSKNNNMYIFSRITAELILLVTNVYTGIMYAYVRNVYQNRWLNHKSEQHYELLSAKLTQCIYIDLYG